jgi:hypothetical protein
MKGKFSRWLASTAFGHVVLLFVTCSVPFGLWSLSVNDWPNPITSAFAREFLLVDLLLGIAVGLIIWKFVTKPIAARMGKLR